MNWNRRDEPSNRGENHNEAVKGNIFHFQHRGFFEL
jgi:hypothetical protein